jgi:AcrR family transcriptional regulator
MDLRVVKTKRAIRNALTLLVDEKSVSEITVKELCERAEISKPAFYSHYGNIYDVVSEIEDEAIAMMCEKLSEMGIMDMCTEKFLIDFGENYYKNPLRNVLRPEAENGTLGRKFNAALVEQKMTLMTAKGSKGKILALSYACDGLFATMERMTYQQFQKSVPDLSKIMRAAMTALD